MFSHNIRSITWITKINELPLQLPLYENVIYKIGKSFTVNLSKVLYDNTNPYRYIYDVQKIWPIQPLIKQDI